MDENDFFTMLQQLEGLLRAGFTGEALERIQEMLISQEEERLLKEMEAQEAAHGQG